MGSIFGVLGGLWFLGAAVLNLHGGDELLSFTRVLYVGLALIAFGVVDWDTLIQSGPDITPIAGEPERPEPPADD
jgi:hypothetical protein